MRKSHWMVVVLVFAIGLIVVGIAVVDPKQVDAWLDKAQYESAGLLPPPPPPYVGLLGD